MYVCIMDHEGTILTHRNLPAAKEALADVLRSYREDLVLAVECIFSWYWVADLCSRIGVEFVLGHALYMKAIHGGKVKNDRIDSQKIASLLRSGMLPMAYVYPKAMRSTRDLLRRNEQAKRYHKRLVGKYGNAKALSIIAQKLGRTVYVMLKRRTPFDAKLFFETVIR
jgi:hypothetical protein